MVFKTEEAGERGEDDEGCEENMLTATCRGGGRGGECGGHRWGEERGGRKQQMGRA